MQFLLIFKHFSLSIEPTAGDSVTIWLHSRLRVSKQGSRDSSVDAEQLIMQYHVFNFKRTTWHLLELIGVEVPMKCQAQT